MSRTFLLSLALSWKHPYTEENMLERGLVIGLNDRTKMQG
ncbi:MAG: hypothetical protein NVS4B9_27100 [Ktedonobacteraceae bacterium]